RSFSRPHRTLHSFPTRRSSDLSSFYKYRHLIHRRSHAVLLTTAILLIVEIIIPRAFWQIDNFGFFAWINDRRNNDTITKSKFFFTQQDFINMLFQEGYSSQDRHSILVLLPKCSVDVRQQLIPQFNKFLANGFPFFTKTPRFAIAGISCGMYTHEWRKHAKLHPAGIQFTIRISGKSTDIRATKRKSRNGKALQLQRPDAQMFPSSHIIPCPYRRIALSSRIGCTRNREWTLVFI